MFPEITESLPPLTEQRLAEVEKQLSIKLPDQYRGFLLKHNGGSPFPSDCFDFTENGNSTSDTLRLFLGIHELPYNQTTDSQRDFYFAYDFIGQYETYKTDNKRMPDELVPIGYDSFGNNICISIFGENVGAIYFWDHENEVDPEEDEEIDWYRNVHFIAPSFNEFLDNLYEDK